MFSTASSSLTSLASDGPLERVEVHAHEVDRLDPLGLERRQWSGSSRTASSAGVKPRVKRLDPPVEDLRRAGQLGDVAHLEIRPREARRRCRRWTPARLPAGRARGRSPRRRSCRRPRPAPAGRGSPRSGWPDAPFAGGCGRGISHSYCSSRWTSRGFSGIDADGPGGDHPNRLGKELDARPGGSAPRAPSGRECMARRSHAAR